MGGYTGKILRVNLTDEEINIEPLNENYARKYIGGRGLATKYYMDIVKDAKIDPLDEKNAIIFATGPLTGTPSPSASRYMVVTKGYLNNAIAGSNSGGFFGPELKFAGFDMVIVEGKANRPVYLFIKDGKVELRDASHLWGKDTHETTDMIHKELGDDKIEVACIGPAGENLVRFAAIINDKHRAAGRTGVGAVMGSKKLKAIAVRGTGKIQIADKSGFTNVLKDKLKKIKENSVTAQGLPTYGTAVLVNIINSQGLYPTKNFQFGQWEHANELSGESMSEKYLIKNKACFACPIACGRITKLDDLDSEGPEYESLWTMSADLDIKDFEKVIEANYYCDKYGLDTISFGGTLAAAMELYEKGFIKDSELDGIKLKFGNAEALVKAPELIAFRKGFGNKLAEGSYRLASSYGHPEFSMSAKKQELPAYDPRGAYGHGLEYATSNRGGCHVRGYMISPEILGLPEKLDPLKIEGKGAYTKMFQDLTAVIDSSGLCLFTSFALGADDYKDLLNAVTGFNYTTEEIMLAGERIWNLERIYDLNAGFTKNDDSLPPRLTKEPMPDGPNKGSVLPLDILLKDYYKARGWDEEGRPTKEKLKSLDL
ncbi:MAG: aldehyde ferredoxin oxidoreductase family protein [Thermoplasmata archaeon]|nr:aldehyde ferredoxin oxidoreductase family protein [Thermoplasmata archaeon]